jgi:hypothetical protein
MFQRVEASQLKKHKKYLINNTYCGIYKEHVMQHILFKTCYLTGYLSYRTIFTTEDKFYQYVSHNPQGKMERRAVNLIVRRLIGDEYFEW